MDNVITEVKKLINGTRDEKIAIIAKNTELQLKNKLLNGIELSDDIEKDYKIPAQLNYILTEVMLIRFGRLGSEGVISETVSGLSIKYVLPESDFDAFNDDIRGFLNRGENKKKSDGSVWFI